MSAKKLLLPSKEIAVALESASMKKRSEEVASSSFFSFDFYPLSFDGDERSLSLSSSFLSIHSFWKSKEEERVRASDIKL